MGDEPLRKTLGLSRFGRGGAQRTCADGGIVGCDNLQHPRLAKPITSSRRDSLVWLIFFKQRCYISHRLKIHIESAQVSDWRWETRDARSTKIGC